MTPEEREALRTLAMAIAKHQGWKLQLPNADTAAVMREAQNVAIALQWVAEYLAAEGEVKT